MGPRDQMFRVARLSGGHSVRLFCGRMFRWPDSFVAMRSGDHSLDGFVALRTDGQIVRSFGCHVISGQMVQDLIERAKRPRVERVDKGEREGRGRSR
jgi:hypothetical protein